VPVRDDSEAGLLANRYFIRSTLGKGGFGQTFLAEDTHTPSRRLRVVKQLKPQNADPELYPLIRERFEREAATLERLGEASDQIPTLHAYFSEAGEFYLVQDWVEGQSLAQKVRSDGPLSESEVREFLCDILPVLDFVHGQGVIHRDISPNNVMLRERDGKPVLIDFGAVKEVVTTVIDGHGLPSTTIAIGSPGYMPLEQYAGRPVFASDIFSLGLTAVYALTGKPPQRFRDPRTGGVAWREHAPGVSRELAEVLSKAVEENARERFPGAREMLEALQPRQARVFRVSRRDDTAELEDETTLISDETVVSRDIGGRGADSVNITEPAILIRINQQYREGMSAQALYDATRGIWKLGPRRERARYALAVFRGVVREVYVIERWYPAGATFKDVSMRVPGRWEFTGRAAEERVRDKYLGRSVAHYFKQGQQNPVVYVNC
jgi:serine/threonine protein kinase